MQHRRLTYEVKVTRKYLIEGKDHEEDAWMREGREKGSHYTEFWAICAGGWWQHVLRFLVLPRKDGHVRFIYGTAGEEKNRDLLLAAATIVGQREKEE